MGAAEFIKGITMHKAFLACAVLAFSIAQHDAVGGEPPPSRDTAVSQPSELTPVERASRRVGVKIIHVAVPERGGEMDVTLWYPAAGSGRSMLVGDSNPLFQDTAAIAEAPMVQGRRPLIVLSQGGLRSAPNIGAWMASRLSGEGFLVAMLRQPDPTRLTEEQTLPEIWLRPADVSAALTAILGDGALSPLIDTKQIGVLGFQIGGTAALALAGGLLDVASVKASCDAAGVGVDCGRFRKAGLDLHTISLLPLGRSNADPRITAIVVIDPEFSRSFTPASLAAISIPVHLINLGKPETSWPGLNAGAVSRIIPSAQYSVVPDATQYSAFPECKPGAAAMLREDAEEALCDDIVAGRSRAVIHDALAGMVATTFHADFATNR